MIIAGKQFFVISLEKNIFSQDLQSLYLYNNKNGIFDSCFRQYLNVQQPTIVNKRLLIGQQE